MKFAQVFLILTCLFLGACSHVRVVTPNPRIETPEVRGDRNKWKFAVAGGNAHMFYATDEGGKRPPDMTKPQVLGHLDVHPGAYFAPAAPLEIGAELNVLGTGMNGIAKLQIIGDGSRHAKEGDFALAVYARSGFVQSDNSGDQKDLFGDGGYNWSSKTRNSFAHAGISAGHHVSDIVLLYVGVAGGKYWAEARIGQDPSGTDPGGSYKQTYTGEGLTTGAGAQWAWKSVQFYVSGEYTHVDYGPADDMEALFLHTGVTFTPGNSQAAAAEPLPPN